MPKRTNLATPEQIASLQGEAEARAARRRRGHPEQTFTDGVKRYAIRGGWLPYHTLRSKGSDPGFPDLILMRPPRLVIAELKVAGGTVTDWQQAWLTGFEILARLAGPHLIIEIYVWRPADWPTIEAVLS
jgi:hypothetical protein